MAAVGLTPSATVIAENIRDLQHWPRHDSGLSGLGLLRPLPLPAERARNARDPARGDARVARCRVELVVAQRPRVIMLTFYVIEIEGSVEWDQLLADAAGDSAREIPRYPPP